MSLWRRVRQVATLFHKNISSYCVCICFVEEWSIDIMWSNVDLPSIEAGIVFVEASIDEHTNPLTYELQKLSGRMAMGMIWICKSSRTNCVEAGAREKYPNNTRLPYNFLVLSSGGSLSVFWYRHMR